MNKVRKNSSASQRAASMVEYAILVAFIAMLSVALVRSLGLTVFGYFQEANEELF